MAIDAEFTAGSLDGFVYADNLFRGTRESSKFADGYSDTTPDRHDVLTVQLGGVNDGEIQGMSGGWQRQFSLTQKSDVTIHLVFQIEIASEFEAEEFSQALCSIDGTLHGSDSTGIYLGQLAGNGDNNGGNMMTGFEMVTLQVPNLAVGSHTIVVGGYLERKTTADEVAWIRFDSVKVTSLPSVQRRTFLRA